MIFRCCLIYETASGEPTCQVILHCKFFLLAIQNILNAPSLDHMLRYYTYHTDIGSILAIHCPNCSKLSAIAENAIVTINSNLINR